MNRKIVIRLLPFLIFIGIGVFLFQGLSLDPRKLPSTMLDKPVPDLSLPLLSSEQGQVFTNVSMKGKVWLLNVWASWCQACQIEHPVLMDIASEGVEIIGLDYKDEVEKAQEWLSQYGNPFKKVLFDKLGGGGINLGVYGAPETFVIDKQGFIQYKHIGPVTQEIWQTQLKPMLKKADQ
jgi:cytochrome c biogenesis protein CcmG/thiol:disulfide interchange protein DsbE